MEATHLLNAIKPMWIERVSKSLAHGESVRAIFDDQLVEFYNLMTQSIISKDPNKVNIILDRWVGTRTQSELEIQDSSISKILNQMLFVTYDIVVEEMNSDEGLILLGLILPVYTHGLNYAVQKEAQLHFQHIANDLENARENLENLDRSKSDFIAVAAHELKTPLTLIEGYASMLTDPLETNNTDSTIAIYLNGMGNGINRLQEIVNDMIDVSMIDNDLLKINFQPVWIKKLLEIAEHELSKYVEERTQSLIIIDFDGCDQMTYGDPERLYQAIRNILTNAIKYTPDGGKIVVDGRKLPGFIEIVVQDTGIGIDEAFHEQIFEKFSRLGSIQLHSSGKTKFKGGGPGLGLPITKGLIEAHGGAIWVESEGYDEINFPGTKFHILLPILKEPPDKKIAKLFQTLDEEVEYNVQSPNTRE